METLHSWINELYVAAGKPTTRTMESALGISRTTVADTIADRNSPTLPSVLAVVTYLAGCAPATALDMTPTAVKIKARRLYAMERHRATARAGDVKSASRQSGAGPTVFLLLHYSGGHLVILGGASDAEEAKTKAELIHGVAVELPVTFDFREQEPKETT